MSGTADHTPDSDGDGPVLGERFVTETRAATSLSVVDRALYALFARHADDGRHARDRDRYRGTDLRTGFELYLARAYGLSWVVGILAFGLVATGTVASVRTAVGVADLLASLPVGATPVVLLVGTAVGLAAKAGVVRFAGLVLGWRATARRKDIERTLPGAVQYLHVLASGSDDPRTMLRKVADADAYGETAVSIRKTLNTATLRGSLGDGLRRVSRDTPSRDLLAPFLLKFREHATQGERELANYLQMESRMLNHRQARVRQRAEGFLELLAEMFMVLLVLPALLVIVLTVMTIMAPGLSAPVHTPLGTTTVRGATIYASAAFVVGLGVGASSLVDGLRPSGQSVAYARPPGLLSTVRTTLTNPASASVTLVAPAAAVGAALRHAGVRPVNALLLAYVAYGLPVGLVAVRRARRDDAKDREIKDFVHAVSGHVNLGRPFPEAVERVAQEVDLGPLNPDVADLALNMRLTSRTAGATSGRRRWSASSSGSGRRSPHSPSVS